MVQLIKKIKNTAGGFHGWYESDVGIIKKPNSNVELTNKLPEIEEKLKVVVVNNKKINIIKIMNKWAFLKSTRFWALVIIAILGILKVEGILSDAVSNALITIVSGYTIIRTVDRIGDKVGK